LNKNREKAMKFFSPGFVLRLIAVLFLFGFPVLQPAWPIPDLSTQGAWRVDEAYFDFNKAVVKPNAFDFLDRIVDLLKSHPELFVNIYGNTDSVGVIGQLFFKKNYENWVTLFPFVFCFNNSSI